MSDERLNAIRARSRAARPGPWTAIVEGRDQTSGSSFIMIGSGDQRGEDLHLAGEDKPVPTPDYDFIAHARQDIDYLLDEIERLRHA